MHEELKNLSKLTEVKNISFYGSYARGNSNGKDTDTLVFVEGERYCTPNRVFHYTAKLPSVYDIFVYNVEELKGVIGGGLFSPVFVEHLAEHCIPYYGEDLKEIFRDKTNIWEKASRKLGVSWGYFTELSDRIRHLRKGEEEIIMDSLDTKDDEEKYNKQRNRSISAMRIAVRMKGIRLGRFDDKNTVIKTYYENYPIIKDHKNLAISTINNDFSKLSFERAIEEIEIWKDIGEAVLYAVDRELCHELGL